MVANKFSLFRKKAQGEKFKATSTLHSKKRAQMKIQQMSFMLIAITIFFVLVGMFFLVIKFSGLKESATALEEENAMLLVSKLANSPEFSCGQGFGTSKVNCVDADKLLALKERIDDYDKFWGVSNIEVRKIYPAQEDIYCETENFPDCNIIKLRDKEVQGYDVSNFVSLCRKEYFNEEVINRCELAKIIVSYEEK